MLKLSEIMTREVATVSPETTLREAVDLFASKHISGAPVVSGHHVVGVVSAADILELAASTPEGMGESPSEPSWNERPGDDDLEGDDLLPASYYTDWLGDDGAAADRASDGSRRVELLAGHTVDDVMTREPISLAPNDSVLAAADLMRQRGIHRVLIIDEGTLVGIVSALDVARAVAAHKLTAKTYVFNKDRDFGPPRFQR